MKAFYSFSPKALYGNNAAIQLLFVYIKKIGIDQKITHFNIKKIYAKL